MNERADQDATELADLGLAAKTRPVLIVSRAEQRLPAPRLLAGIHRLVHPACMANGAVAICREGNLGSRAMRLIVEWCGERQAELQLECRQRGKGHSVGSATPVIRSVSTPAYMRVSIEASDGNRYEADLSSFSRVSCFPRDAAEWSRVSIDSYGLAILWACRFEVHVDRIVGLATHVEAVSQAGSTPTTSATHP